MRYLFNSPALFQEKVLNSINTELEQILLALHLISYIRNINKNSFSKGG